MNYNLKAMYSLIWMESKFHKSWLKKLVKSSKQICRRCLIQLTVIYEHFQLFLGPGIEAARDILCHLRKPWVMIHVNDDKNLHFCKAQFDPEDCPVDCSRPCENVCPANV
ncbi:uncharacterized protein LOC131637259 [Vicia villosa]|uniref:uncharacterized protein LOC131637259 n=1 Tax=Vicia villosa TaxID=3911 RepID=UPI00273BA6AA|nr:uncharacterized protein LOC131637259 [Vicia villosa]